LVTNPAAVNVGDFILLRVNGLAPQDSVEDVLERVHAALLGNQSSYTTSDLIRRLRFLSIKGYGDKVFT